MYGPIIDKQAVASHAGERLPIVNPATAAAFAEFACASEEDADRAATSSARAWTRWSATPPAKRGQILADMVARVGAASEPLAQQITQEQGKPIAEARLEIAGVVAMLGHFAEVAASFGFALERPGYGANRRIDMQPVGPVVVITTWNFPVETVVVHLAPALAAGCTAVVLANSETPSSVAMLVELLNQTALPDGAVNLLMGDMAALSRRLIRHPAMRHLSYTGSVAVGRVLAEQCGAELMRCTLELGGNAPAIILPGADMETSVQALIAKRFWNAGQVCTAPNRIYVHRSCHDDFAAAAGDYARSLVLGDGSAAGTSMGPLANPRRVEAMRNIAADAIAMGATAVVNPSPPPPDGFFAPPLVFTDMPEAALGMKEEVFGPIACIAPYDELEDAVARANQCALGLSGYVYGPDQPEAEAVAARLQVGSVAVNQPTTAYIDVPFGGIKASGLGWVGGETALHEYLFPRLTAAKP